MNIKKMNGKKFVSKVFMIFLSALITAFALNNFFSTSGLISGGLTGVALIINKLSSGLIPLGAVLFGLNIPLAVLGYLKVGKQFTMFSFLHVAFTSLLVTIVPQLIVLEDVMLNGIIGGVLMGLGTGMALEAGASTGGTDFVALYISVKKQVSAGKYMLILNGIIVLISAYFFNVEIAVYTLISIFVTSKVVDAIHIRYQRVTLAIITSEGEEITKQLIENGDHGVTILNGRGGYSHNERDFLYTVVSTYEMTDIKEMIFDIDKNAFVNVTHSQDVYGYFETSKYD
ncbi:MAG: YitT family protein [Erysipelotrichales bacterium]